jgi:parvulin-like peptidyl-prolyl isomerase
MPPRQAAPPGSAPVAGNVPVVATVPVVPARDPAEPPYEPASILARVGSEVVQAAEVLPNAHQMLNVHIAKLGPDFERAPEEIRKEKIQEWERQVVERVVMDAVNIKLLVAEVKGTVPEDALKKNLERIRKLFNDSEMKSLMTSYKASSVVDLEQKLRAEGGSLESQRTVFVEKYLAISWLNQQVKEQKEPTHEDMVAFYRDHAADWERPARARWEQLTARFDKYPTQDDARRAIAQWGNELLRGAPFAELAKARSHHHSSEEGGLNDWTTQGSLRSEKLDQALFGLPVGALSQIIEDDEGCHIVRVVEREPQHRISFNEAQPEIKKRLKAGDKAEAMNEYVAKLRETVPVWTVFDGGDTITAAKPAEPRR